MIIKNMTRRTASFRQLLSYMVEGINPVDDAHSLILPHNMGRKKTIESWVTAFRANEANRVYRRKDSVKLHHMIISFSNKDYEHITTAMVRDIAKKYLRMRAEHSLAIAIIHTSQSHYHIHICQSGVEIITGKSTRISKTRFKEIKTELQEYQKTKYPQLIHSILDHDLRRKNRISEQEYQLIKRTKQPSHKERTKCLILKLYKQAVSKEDFFKRIEESGLQVYKRNGKQYGILGEQKIRFSTLGVDMLELDKKNMLMQEFLKLRQLPNHRNIEKLYR